MPEQLKPKEVRQARAFLQKKGIPSSEIAPRRLVAARKELGGTFEDTLRFLAILFMAGQGMGPGPKGKRQAERS